MRLPDPTCESGPATVPGSEPRKGSARRPHAIPAAWAMGADPGRAGPVAARPMDHRMRAPSTVASWPWRTFWAV